MRVYAGTSGYSYKTWCGSFYPDKLPAAEMLRFYGERLPAVEINNTFYRMPKKTVLQNWRDQVPDDFRFAIKASRRITHGSKLIDCDEALGFLAGNLATLRESLGAVLFQLPPFLRKGVDRLARFVDSLPEGLPAAFEFRHASWFDEEIHDLLAARDYAIVVADGDEGDLPATIATASWGYLRLRRQTYDDASLETWAERIGAQDWSHVFVFFKHETAGAGPVLASRFMDIVAGIVNKGGANRS